MCPFCIGVAAWAAAGALTTAGLGTLFAATMRGGEAARHDHGGDEPPASSNGDRERQPTD